MVINWLYFCAGISVSHNRLLDIKRDLANWILHQYARDGVFILCNLKKKIFTIIAKDNIDNNATSATATKHYYRKSFSVFQFLSVAFPGDMISYPDELSLTTKSSNSKKVDSLPSPYTEIRRFLSLSTSLTFLTAPIPILPDFDSLVHQQGVKEEYEWLESAYNNKISYWVPWETLISCRTTWHISHLTTNWWTRPYIRYTISLYECHIKYNQYFESWSNTSRHSQPTNLCPYKGVDVRFPDKFDSD